MRGRFVLLTLIWGASFLFIKVGVGALAPVQVAFGRMFFGALTVLAVALARRERLPREPHILGHLFVAALFANSVPFTLFGYAERHITSALASIGNATVPLFTLFFALLLLPSERPTVRRTVGLVVGFGGVCVVLGVWRGLTGQPDSAGILLILVATACYGVSGVYMRRYLSGTSYSSLALTVGQIGIGAMQLALFLPWSPAPAHLPARVIASIVTLGAFGTGVAYVLMYAIIRVAGATIASTVTYFLPIVSIAIGVVGLGERLSWNAPVGAAVIIAGALLSRSEPAPRAEPQLAARASSG